MDIMTGESAVCTELLANEWVGTKLLVDHRFRLKQLRGVRLRGEHLTTRDTARKLV